MSALMNYNQGDIIGKYGVVFIENASWHITPSGKRTRKAVFLCPICNNKFITHINNVKKGTTKSCCQKGNIKHHLSSDRIYFIWYLIKGRIFNKNNSSYKDYGERGISLYPEWENNFQLFYDYISALPNFGKKGYVIDRINNDNNYEPGNLRWVTYHISRVNQRMNRRNKTGYSGVYYNKEKSKYCSTIGVKKRRVFLGCFQTSEEAAIARDNYIKTHNLTEYTLNFK